MNPLPPPDPAALAHSEQLRALIRADIRAQGGSIPFSRYMELALYAPGLGYYSAGSTKFGVAGDFVTAPELGPQFAQCVAEAVSPVLRGIGPESDFVELGGGSGAFAQDVLRALDARHALPRAYRILEPSADLRERQRTRLHAALKAAVFARIEWIDRPPEQPWRGVLFANEVLDALPTTRFSLAQGEVMEEHVALDASGDFTVRLRPADLLVGGAVRHIERSLGRAFEDGYRSEVLPQLPYWIQAVCGTLDRGLALFVDYGYPRSEYYLPERREGTLVCHYRHRAHADPFHLPGLQDLTAFVDFTAVAEAGLHAGFELAGFASQAAFLLNNGLQDRLQLAGADAVAQHRRNLEAKRLTLPGDMGERFKAIGLQRGIDATDQFAFGDQSHRL
ncbi:MAG: SAM-dependent methyltransferase [Chiayiivirga sp.]|jgi:SAM-dependent MidA family methyltransferase|uniref:class I SAM-dependent methyltransferase n=1 Tax=Chiayiivirga sp. TaxID=2041042 RepID=UPI0025BFE711|nr:SAM-dependent methyltransferase [Chiayiivirga sp.]MCI1729614.1 SAM-dependent methyltransferase [Chiayiivirga sp.]